MALAADSRQEGEVAREAGIGPGQLSRWKSGDATPLVTSIEPLVRALRVNAHWLLTGEGSMEPPGPNEATTRLQVIGRVREGDYVGAISDLTAALNRSSGREDVARAAEDLLRTLRDDSTPP